MPKAYFLVRSVVEPPLRQRFDQWYSSHHLPMALSEFKCEKCWRFWSALDAGVHYGRISSPIWRGSMRRSIPTALKCWSPDFDQAWPHGVSRSRDRLEMVEERSGS